MRIIRRLPTVREQDDRLWREEEKWTREVMRELGRLGFDYGPIQTIERGDEPGDNAVVRLYLKDVGARRITVVLRVRADGRITRVGSGGNSWTARQAALWLHKRSPRTKKYL